MTDDAPVWRETWFQVLLGAALAPGYLVGFELLRHKWQWWPAYDAMMRMNPVATAGELIGSALVTILITTQTLSGKKKIDTP